MPTVKFSKSSHPETRRIEVMVRRKMQKHNWFAKEAGVIWATPCPQWNVSYAHVALFVSLGEKLPGRWTRDDPIRMKVYSKLYYFRKYKKLLQTNEKRRFKLTW